jgi:heme exporter protein CcmD
MNDPHFAFIFASYAISGAVIGLLVAWTILDYRQLRAALSRLPAREEG